MYCRHKELIYSKVCNWDTALVLFFSSELHIKPLPPSIPDLPFSVTAFPLPLPPLSLPPPPSLVLAGPLLPPVPWVMLWNQVRLVKTAAGLCTVAREEGGEEKKGGRWGREEGMGGCSTDWAYGYCICCALLVMVVVIHNPRCTLWVINVPGELHRSQQ